MANYRKTKKHGNTTITSSAGGSSSHSYSSGSKSHRISNRHRAGRVITRTTTRIGDWIKVTQKTSPNHKSKSTSYKSKANSKPLTNKQIDSLFNISMAAMVLPFVFVWYSIYKHNLKISLKIPSSASFTKMSASKSEGEGS